jgi:hypothetical protein
MGVFWLLVGVGLGFFFKPQIEKGLQKVRKMLQDNRSGDDY